MTGTKSKLCQILNSWLSVLLTAFFVLCEVQLNVWCSQQVDFSIFILSDGLLVLTVFVHHNVGLFCFFFFFNCQKCLTTIFRCGLCLITLVMEDQWNWISGAEVYTGSWIYWYTEKKKKKTHLHCEQDEDIGFVQIRTFMSCRYYFVFFSGAWQIFVNFSNYKVRLSIMKHWFISLTLAL